MSKIFSIHNAGFFSCCSVRLYDIIHYFNEYHETPDIVDSAAQFALYKDNDNVDLCSIYFRTKNTIIPYKETINYDWEYQYVPYHTIRYDLINPFIGKYFTPNIYVECIVEQFIRKYKIDFSTTAYVLYRGNDKITETRIGKYETFIDWAHMVQIKNPNIRFMIQTDENEFKEAFMKEFVNSFVIEEIPIIYKSGSGVVHKVIPHGERQEFGGRFLASIICGSRCSHVITHSGNCGMWTALYRGNTSNVYQYLSHQKYDGWFVT